MTPGRSTTDFQLEELAISAAALRSLAHARLTDPGDLAWERHLVEAEVTDLLPHLPARALAEVAQALAQHGRADIERDRDAWTPRAGDPGPSIWSVGCDAEPPAREVR